MQLGFPDFSYADLHTSIGLARLDTAFLSHLRAHAPDTAARLLAARAQGDLPANPETSALLMAVAPYLGDFVATLFGVEAERRAERQRVQEQAELFRVKNDFIQKRVLKKGGDKATADEFPSLDERVKALFALFAPTYAQEATRDGELALARVLAPLLDLQKFYEKKPTPKPEDADDVTRAHTLALRKAAQQAALVDLSAGDAAQEGTILGDGLFVKNVLTLIDRWCFARSQHPRGKAEIKGWVSYKVPNKLDYENLVQIRRPRADLPEQIGIHDEHHLRRRDGFGLTDTRGSERVVLSEINYCIICHERSKDSCSKGFREKTPAPDGTTPFKKNPLGASLTGCPLEEHISEMHALKGQGDAMAALAMICINNPMLPGTGHRICNDCMKGCIYQTQEPVNIPQVETRVLTDVLEMPYGFEMWSLLTRWNPLNIKRPFALPYNGKKVLVVGMGPAGYTLAHHLLNEGFGVVGIDGLKIEPLPEALMNEPIRDWNVLRGALDERILSGFGGVSEYGITVRWDKNFLTMLYLNLARRQTFSVFGGVRFGGTLSVQDAWDLGFDHVALAAGAGKPTIIGLENNLLPGIRKASDFLMALQLSGAFKRDSLAALQVKLPAVVIGGGLTAIDTATELFAYYPVQVEKVLARFEALAQELGDTKARQAFTKEEQESLDEMLAHGRAIRGERERARAVGEAPNFVPLVQSWGGVSLVYRKTLQDSPAYRLNHEEVEKSLEEGIHYIECMDPRAALPDSTGAVRALRFERQKLVDGKWHNSGELVELPARTVCVAAGTSPNVMVEKEAPGQFQLDKRGQYFVGNKATRNADGTLTLSPSVPYYDLSGEAGFFTSYLSADKKRCVSFYGDNHPQYAGSVVKAMASAKDGYGKVREIFARDVASLSASEQPARDSEWQGFAGKLSAALSATVVEVKRLTPTIVEVIVRAPNAALHFQPGQFYRLQSFEALSPLVEETRLTTEGLALTGAWVDKSQGLLSLIVLEMGASSRLCAALRPGDPVVCMGPTGTPTEIPQNEKVLLLGGGLGNAVLFSIARALKQAGNDVIYFAGYRDPIDVFKMDEIEAGTDQVIWASDKEPRITPRRPQDNAFVGNIVQAVLAYAKGDLGEQKVNLKDVDRIIVIGSDRMMAAVKAARKQELAPFLKANHHAIGSINSPMQCMMKEICAQCLQRHVTPDGKVTYVFSCMNQDQDLDAVDFPFLNARLKVNVVQEKLANLWLDHCLRKVEVSRI